jgi:membrane-associated HD superfamily phosphohydrolase
MKDLKNILNKFADTSIVAGEYELSEKQIDSLKEHLEKLKKKNKLLLIGCCILMISLFIATIIFSTNTAKLEDFLGKSSILGISLAGIATISYKIWKEINYIDLILIFIKSMDGETIKAIINEVFKKI